MWLACRSFIYAICLPNLEAGGKSWLIRAASCSLGTFHTISALITSRYAPWILNTWFLSRDLPREYREIALQMLFDTMIYLFVCIYIWVWLFCTLLFIFRFEFLIGYKKICVKIRNMFIDEQSYILENLYSIYKYIYLIYNINTF